MIKSIAFVMDSIFNINIDKDSSFAMMLSAQKRAYKIFCLDIDNITMKNKDVMAVVLEINVFDSSNFVNIISKKLINLNTISIIIMRKDPPFNMNYIYATYLLEFVAKQGVLVLNKPQALRDFNEKFAIMHFPNCITDTIISIDINIITEFINKQKTAIIKPLDAMGGVGIYKVSINDNYQKIIKKISNNFKTPIMVQKYLDDIQYGDKRILMINGKPIPYALARIPKKGSFKGNLSAGATGIGQELSTRDKYLCTQIAPTLVANGLDFVGLDVIGDYISEINITSPTGIRELDSQYNIDIAGIFLDYIETIV